MPSMPVPMRWETLRVRGMLPTIKNHTATAISRHELLVFGGYDGRQNHNALYLFDSRDNAWTLLTSAWVRGVPPAGRNGHTATLAERQVFIIGGWLGAGPLAADDMHVLDLSMMMWARPSVLGTPPGPCNMHTADYVPHLRSILVFRGGDGREYLNDLHAVDVVTKEWHRVETQGQLPVPRANHSSALVNDDQIVIFGGWDGHRRLNDVHILDTHTMVWSRADVNSSSLCGGALPHPRAGMTFVRHRERVFLFGGSGPAAKCFSDLHIYDPHNRQWLDVMSVEDTPQLGSITRALDGDDEDESEASGGTFSSQSSALAENDASGDDGAAIDDDFVFIGNAANPNETNLPRPHEQIVVVGQGPGSRAGHTCTVLEDRKLFIFGGSFGNVYLNDFFVLDTDPPPRAMITEALAPAQMLQHTLGRYFNSEEFADVVFVVEGHVVYAHKLVLSALSERFRGMLSGRFLETQQKEIVVPDIRYPVFLRMLEYLYTGKLCEISPLMLSNGNDDDGRIESNQSGDNLEDELPMVPSEPSIAAGVNWDVGMLLELLLVSDQYMLDHLKQLCECVLQYRITTETVGDIFSAATQSNAVQLKAICLHFLRNHDIELVTESETSTATSPTSVSKMTSPQDGDTRSESLVL